MLKSIGNGAELFHELIESNCYYVDKTPFIRTVFKETHRKSCSSPDWDVSVKRLPCPPSMTSCL